MTRAAILASLNPITAQVCPPDERYWLLLDKDIAGTITPEEDAELLAMMEAKEAAYEVRHA